MKRILVYTFFLLFVCVAKNSFAQVTFWYETFGAGCNQGQLANGASPTGTNGPWSTSVLGAPGNGAQANEWFVSATEAGRPLGTCGDGCLNNAGFTNRSLHIGVNSPPAPPTQDVGAFYLMTGTSNTNKRAESPTINCTGKNNIVLSFNYLANSNVNDFAEALYYDGISWSLLPGGQLAPSVGTCAPQGLWTNVSYTLPNSASGNPNVKIGFRWQNSTIGPGNISVAIDEITLAAPTVSFVTPLSGCPNVCFTPTVVAPFVVPAPTSYSWSTIPSGTITNPTSSVPCIAIPSVGVCQITCYAMNGAAITASVTQTISIVANVVFTLTSSPTTVCLGQSANLTAFGGVTYTWSPIATLSPTQGAGVVATPSFATTYTANGNDAAGCPGVGTILVNIGQAPVISVVATASAVCTGFTSTLTASGAGSYTWTGTSFTVAMSGPSVVAGPGTYTVTGSTVGVPCTSFSVVNIALAPPLNIQLTQSSLTTCIASNFPKYSKAVTLMASGASVYNWSPGASLNYSIGPSVLARPPVSTCYLVTGLTSVCSGSAIICVTVIPQFTMDVIPKQPLLCYGDSILLRIANIGTTAIMPYTYNWSEPSNAPPPSINDPFSPTVQISPTNSVTPVTYTAEVYDARGCISNPRLITTTVLPQPLTAISIPTIITGGMAVQTNSVCYVGSNSGSNPEAIINYTAVFTNSASVPPGVQPSYTWVPPYNNGSNSPYVSILSTANGNTVILAAPLRMPSVAVYTLKTGYNGIQGCTRMDTVSVRVVDCRSITATVVQFTTAVQNDTICSRTCVTFLNLVDTAAGGPQTYTWTFPGGAPATSTLANPTTCYNLPGSYNVILKTCNPYDKPNGSCGTKGVQKFIKVVDIPNPKILPAVSFPKDTIIRFGMAVTLTATNALSYVWSPPYHISSQSGSMVTVSPLHTTQYVVTGYNSKQCYSRDTLNVIVIDDCGEMFVPNAFSPNGDGYNDVLKVRGLCLESLTFMVFNRWGEKVFETANKEVGWDGTYQGELMNTAVFVYRLEGKTYSGKAYSMKGNVTLMR